VVVKLAPEPLQPGRILTRVVGELVARRTLVRFVAFAAGGVLRARGIGGGPAGSVGLQVERLAFELGVKMRHRRLGMIDWRAARAQAIPHRLGVFLPRACLSRLASAVVTGAGGTALGLLSMRAGTVACRGRHVDVLS
jgi:hypothetical protein